jgi:hypothetical protein
MGYVITAEGNRGPFVAAVLTAPHAISMAEALADYGMTNIVIARSNGGSPVPFTEFGAYEEPSAAADGIRHLHG